MKKDTYTTDIVFRVDTSKEFKGTVFALFPHEVCDFDGNVTTYEHIGQHSTATYDYCIKISRLATESEYNDLKKEMESLGYNINVVTKRNYAKYLASYKERTNK